MTESEIAERFPDGQPYETFCVHYWHATYLVSVWDLASYQLMGQRNNRLRFRKVCPGSRSAKLVVFDSFWFDWKVCLSGIGSMRSSPGCKLMQRLQGEYARGSASGDDFWKKELSSEEKENPPIHPNDLLVLEITRRAMAEVNYFLSNPYGGSSRVHLPFVTVTLM